MKNSVTDVSATLRPPCLCPSGGHKHGVSIQSSINLGDTLLQITCEWKTAETWFLPRLFIYQSSIVSQTLDFFHCMVTIFILITWLVKTENNKSTAKPTRIGHVRYINILTWLWGFQVKLLYLVLFSLYLSLFWELRDKRNLTKICNFDPKASEPCLNINISNVAYSSCTSVLWYF